MWRRRRYERGITKCSCGKDPIVKELYLKGYGHFGVWRYLIKCCDRVYKSKLEDSTEIWNERRKVDGKRNGRKKNCSDGRKNICVL